MIENNTRAGHSLHRLHLLDVDQHLKPMVRVLLGLRILITTERQMFTLKSYVTYCSYVNFVCLAVYIFVYSYIYE